MKSDTNVKVSIKEDELLKLRYVIGKSGGRQWAVIRVDKQKKFFDDSCEIEGVVIGYKNYTESTKLSGQTAYHRAEKITQAQFSRMYANGANEPELSKSRRADGKFIGYNIGDTVKEYVYV